MVCILLAISEAGYAKLIQSEKHVFWAGLHRKAAQTHTSSRNIILRKGKPFVEPGHSKNGEPAEQGNLLP